MQTYLLRICFILSIIGSPSLSLAIQKCVDANGKISFQDKPCPTTSKAEEIKLESSSPARNESDEINLVTLSLNSGKDYFIGVPSNWETTTQTAPNRESANLRAASNDSSPAVLLMTIIEPKMFMGDDRLLLSKAMKRINAQYAPRGAHQKKVGSFPLKLRITEGLVEVATFQDKSLMTPSAKAKGEYPYVTAGAIVIKGTIINITLLSHSVTSNSFISGLAAIEAIGVSKG